MVVCRVCGEELINYQVGQSIGLICRDCFKAYHRHWKQNNPNRMKRLNRERDWARNNYLGMRLANGGTRYVRVQGKRPYTGFCELCGLTDEKLIYHHWNNNDFSKGLWLCLRHHNAEKGLPQKYLELKQKIENGVQTK